jgi:hypothetical protein
MKREDKQHLADWLCAILIVAIGILGAIIIVSFGYFDYAYGTPVLRTSATVQSVTYPHPWFQLCLPNCGYQYQMKLSNGTVFSYIDTCQYSVGESVNLTYFSKGAWQATVVCD